MGLTNFPKGITSMGIPVPFGAVVGQVLFVDSNNGSNNYKGILPTRPLATVAAAISKAAENKNDVIVLMPGHAENLSTAAIFAVAEAGLTIIGVGDGTRIPTFSCTATAGALTVTDANLVLRHVKFVANYDGGTAAAITLDASSDGAVIDDCHFRDTSTGSEFLTHIKIAQACDNITIKDCTFIGLAGTMTNSLLFAHTTANTVIKDNYFFVDSSDDVIDHVAQIATNICLLRNRIHNIDTDGAIDCIALCSASTGLMGGNYGYSDKNTATIFTADAAHMVQNFGHHVSGASGVIVPAAGSSVP